MSNKRIRRIFLGARSGVSLFEIVSFAQERHVHFCSMKGVIKGRSLTFEQCPYQGMCLEDDVPDRVMSLNGSVFEYFLQSVRKNLVNNRGKRSQASFANIFVRFTKDRLKVCVNDSCKSPKPL